MYSTAWVVAHKAAVDQQQLNPQDFHRCVRRGTELHFLRAASLRAAPGLRRRVHAFGVWFDF